MDSNPSDPNRRWRGLLSCTLRRHIIIQWLARETAQTPKNITLFRHCSQFTFAQEEDAVQGRQESRGLDAPTKTHGLPDHGLLSCMEVFVWVH